MKKLIAFVLIACMVLSFAGCGKDENVLKVALSPDFAPMEFVDISKTGQDSYVGFDVSLAKFIAEEMGMELEIVPMGFNACQVAVSTGAVDMSISGFSWDEDRAANYNLSDYYYAGENETEQVIITTKENEGKLTKAEDFSGLKVAAQTASIQLNLCNDQLPEDCEIIEIGDLNTAFLQLKNGDFDAVAVAKGQADVVVANNSDTIAFSGFEFVVSAEMENNVILLKKGADELTEKVNEILAKALEAGYYEIWYEEALALSLSDVAGSVTLPDEVPED